MENTFTTIASYQYSSEAAIVKGRLEAEGIEVFMADSYTIETDPLVSNAIGGVKLYVSTHQLREAQQVLEDISRFSMDDMGEKLACPDCGSEAAELVTTVKDKKSFFAFLFGAGLFGTLPLYTKYIYKCNDCRHEFE